MQRFYLHRAVADMPIPRRFAGSSTALIRLRSVHKPSLSSLMQQRFFFSTAMSHPISFSSRAGWVFPSTSLLSPTFGSTFRWESSAKSETPKGGAVEASEETHPDFQPRAITSECSEEEVGMIKKDIRDTIAEENVVIFIKGVPEAPMCAYSKKLVDIMECLGLTYTSFDVLAHPVVRSYVKEVSEWPTIPQLFLKGEFAGGLDIVLKMALDGELQLLLDSKGIAHRDQKKKKQE